MDGTRTKTVQVTAPDWSEYLAEVQLEKTLETSTPLLRLLREFQQALDRRHRVVARKACDDDDDGAERPTLPSESYLSTRLDLIDALTAFAHGSVDTVP